VLAEDPTKALHAKNQVALIDFLSADLDVAFTMLKTAEIESQDDPDHCRAALTKVRAALDTIRRFERGIDDPQSRKTIHDRADELNGNSDRFSEVKPK
jgi:hypothetical protein